jgi:hypothetical protein
LAGASTQSLSLARLIEEVLGQELERLQAAGLTRGELIVLSEYTPPIFEGLAAECWHHPLLGFNHKQVYEGDG